MICFFFVFEDSMQNSNFLLYPVNLQLTEKKIFLSSAFQHYLEISCDDYEIFQGSCK